MSMKRRVVYLSDEQWAELQRQAREEKVTISALIRDRALNVAGDLHRDRARDDAKVEYDTRPVRTFTPVPKPSKRR